MGIITSLYLFYTETRSASIITLLSAIEFKNAVLYIQPSISVKLILYPLILNYSYISTYYRVPLSLI